MRADIAAIRIPSLLHSQPGFTAKTPREMFSQLLSQPPIPLNQARPGLRFPTAVESVVMRALSKDPSKRYSDSVTFATELTNALANPQDDEDADGLLARMKSLFRKK